MEGLKRVNPVLITNRFNSVIVGDLQSMCSVNIWHNSPMRFGADLRTAMPFRYLVPDEMIQKTVGKWK